MLMLCSHSHSHPPYSNPVPIPWESHGIPTGTPIPMHTSSIEYENPTFFCATESEYKSSEAWMAFMA